MTDELKPNLPKLLFDVVIQLYLHDLGAMSFDAKDAVRTMVNILASDDATPTERFMAATALLEVLRPGPTQLQRSHNALLEALESCRYAFLMHGKEPCCKAFGEAHYQAIEEADAAIAAAKEVVGGI